MTGNQLKILALVAMTLDHIGVVLLPQCVLLRAVGRLAFPIFAYMVAEGCFYTHSKRRYFGGMLVLGVVCQAAYFIALGSLEQSIVTTLVLGMLTVFGMQHVAGGEGPARVFPLAGALALDVFMCLVLPALLWHTDYSIDYGLVGVLLPAFVYLPRIFCPGLPDARRRLVTLVSLAVGLVLLAVELRFGLGQVQWFGLLALVPLAFYNGARGTWRLKYLFYIYYPAHLIVIWGIFLLLRELSLA